MDKVRFFKSEKWNSTHRVVQLDDDLIVRFIKTGFKNGDNRLYLVIEESAHDGLQGSEAVSGLIMTEDECLEKYGNSFLITGNSHSVSDNMETWPPSEDYDYVKHIKHLIGKNHNDQDLGRAVRNYQLKQTSNG
tara:strand:+ start:122 stop:523 length:402 start_codon:yes stop_codon:yes gene_type:complete